MDAEDADGQNEPIDDDERELLRQDLDDVEALKHLLAPRGLKGVIFYCPDCEEDHYLTWDLLRGNLKQLLEEGESPVHEPAFEPDPDEYVTWDYARGFLDGYETLQDEETDEIADRISAELAGRGWAGSDIDRLLSVVELRPPDGGTPSESE
jgi:hypothetical protein